MKKFRVLTIAFVLVLSLAATVFAVSRLTTNSVVENVAASCCNDAGCCTGGACKMNGSCCAKHDACPMKKQAGEKKTASFAGVPVEDATSQSCHHNNAQASTVGKEDCCAGGGSVCCSNNGSCCKSKAKTSASL